MAKDKDYRRLINSVRWLRLRKMVLTLHPTCQRCEAEGRIGIAATEVHHVTPVEYAVTYAEKERLMYNPANLQALCHECHVTTHKEMGRSGKRATARRNEAHARNFAKKYFDATNG